MRGWMVDLDGHEQPVNQMNPQSPVASLLGGQCLSLADYVTGTAPTGEAVAAVPAAPAGLRRAGLGA